MADDNCKLARPTLTKRAVSDEWMQSRWKAREAELYQLYKWWFPNTYEAWKKSHEEIIDIMEAAPPTISNEEFREIEQNLRSMVEHDNELLNHRIQWFLTINGFLFTAIAIYGNQPGRSLFGSFLVLVALSTCLSFSVALSIGRNGWYRLTTIWDFYCESFKGEFARVGVFGYRATFRESYIGPWRMLPWILGTGWGGVLVFVWLYPGQRPAGSFSTVAVRPGEQEVQVWDTSIGAKNVNESPAPGVAAAAVAGAWVITHNAAQVK